MKNKVIHKGMNKLASKAALTRHDRIGKKLNLALIQADHVIDIDNMHKGYDLCKDMVIFEINHYKHFTNSKFLKYFSGHDKWLLLLEIIKSSSKGEIIYKEQLARKIKCSHKTLTKYIDECIEGSFFIYLNPINQVVKDKRIVNIRPSEELIIAFINYQVEKIQNSLAFLKEHSRIIIS